MLKKLLFILLITFISVPVFSQTTKPEKADKILRTAIEEALAQDKNVFVIFHASWCSWCRRLEKAITSDELKKIFDNNFVITHIDVLEREDKIEQLENPGGKEIMAKFGGEKSGLPFYVFLDSKGKVISRTGLDFQLLPGIRTARFRLHKYRKLKLLWKLLKNLQNT